MAQALRVIASLTYEFIADNVQFGTAILSKWEFL
jgi:hypothetical protein